MKLVNFGLWIVLSVFSSHVGAATLQISSGELIGATEVDVNGTLYDIEFISQNCFGLFSGCDSENDFAFNTIEDADAASLALEQQVFNDSDAIHLNYDTNPQFTANITNSVSGQILTPYTLRLTGPSPRGVFTSAFTNSTAIVDSIELVVLARGSRPFGDATYAVWSVAQVTVVPLPSAVWLFGTGIAGLLGLPRRKKA